MPLIFTYGQVANIYLFYKEEANLGVFVGITCACWLIGSFLSFFLSLTYN